jgi:(p)ppGpp synthase/HD superfamily hydrolase
MSDKFTINRDWAEAIARRFHALGEQTRADGVTPYIEHPKAVVRILTDWRRRSLMMRTDASFSTMIAAAWLHDTIEDTELTLDLLHTFELTSRAIDLVDLLTKRLGHNALERYYAGISTDPDAPIIKAADRCSNLDDALVEVQHGRNVERWQRYVIKTGREILPLVEHLPGIFEEVATRLRRLDEAVNERMHRELLDKAASD